MAKSEKNKWERIAVPRNASVEREQLAIPRVSTACAVFLDISGYTPFAEAIIKNHGDRGIGTIVDALTSMFEPVAETALKHSGNIIAIEGDAMLISFSSIKEGLGFCSAAHPHRKQTLKAFGRTFPLQIDIGLAHGRLYEFIAQDGERRAYLACGSALREANRLEKLSKNGSIAHNLRVDGHGKMQDDQMPGEDTHAVPRKNIREMIGGLFKKDLPVPEKGYADSFIPDYLSGPQHSQLLSPVIIFSDFPLIRLAFSKLAPKDGKPDPTLAKDALDDFFISIRTVIEDQAGGYIAKLKDQNSMFLLGAPGTCEDARYTAFEVAAKMHDIHDKLCAKYHLDPISASTGMHKGQALCGLILGRYDAIGESVNLASRIKSSVDPRERKQRRRIRFTREMIDGKVSRMIKGYEVDHCQFNGMEDTKTVLFDYSTSIGRETDTLPGDQTSDVLRQKELDTLRRLIRGTKGGKGRIVNVLGGIGSGKDRLLSLVCRELETEFQVCEVRCSPLFKKDPYRTLFELMKKVDDLQSDEKLFRDADGKPDESEGLADMKKRFFERLRIRPAVYVINNGDNIDMESAVFLDRFAPELAEAGCSVLYSGGSRLLSEGEDFLVKDLDHDDALGFAAKLARKHHPDAKLPDQALEEIFRISGGNPLHISELVKAMGEDVFGRLNLPGKVPDKLKDIMLMNIQQSLSDEQYETLRRYSLMHSVAMMAPLIDNEADMNMRAFIEKGFLNRDKEFENDLLRSSLAETMDPRARQETSLALAKEAERVKMKNELAIFEYYQNAELTTGNRANALIHAERHVNNVPFFYLIRERFFDDAMRLADLADDNQRKICGNMLQRKAYLISRIDNDLKTMEKRLGILDEALGYLEGSGEGYKVKTQMAATLCKLGRMGNLDNPELGEKRMSDGKALFRKAMQEALDIKKVDAYLAIVNTFAGNLIIYCKEPRAALALLEEAEQTLLKLPPLEDTKRNTASLAMLDKMYAEAYKELGDFDLALKKLRSGLEKSERAGYAQGVLYCRATEAQVRLRSGDTDEAQRWAVYCIDYMREQSLEDAEVMDDMEKVLEDVEKLRNDDATAVR